MSSYSIQLYKTSIKSFVEASLVENITDQHLESWEKSWLPIMQAHCKSIDKQCRPEDSHWDWRMKSSHWNSQLAYHSFAIECEDELQGMMLLNDLASARLQTQFGKPIIYIEFLATAPWNRPEIQKPPKFKLIGKNFIGAAIEFSRNMDYKGRLGLHSLPAAVAYYQEKCGITMLGPDSSHQNLVYFEMTPKQATLFNPNKQTP